MEELIPALKKQIIEKLKLSDISPDDIDADAPLIGAGLGLDSIDTLELLVLLEREYSVTVPDITAGRQVFSSVRSMAQYITERQAQA